jgi:hypothetical protein
VKQAAGRLALEFAPQMRARVAALVEERGRLTARLADLPVDVWPSGANFVLFRPRERDGALFRLFYNFLPDDLRKAGGEVAQAHLTHLNPFPRNTGDVLRSYDRVLVPEMNLGQLLKLVRAEFLVDAVGYNRVRGLPFTSAELADAIEGML